MVLHGHENGVDANEEGDCVLEPLVLHQLEEVLACGISRLVNLGSQILHVPDLLDFDPTFLLLRDKHVSQFFSFFDGIKVVDDYTNEQVNNKLTSNNHERDEVDDEIGIRELLWLQSNTSAINSVKHHFNPSLSSCHLKEGTHGRNSVIKV